MTALRTAFTADAQAIAQVHVAGWQAAYRGLLPDSLLDSLSVERRAAEWQGILTAGNGYTLIYEVDGTVVGFAGCGACRDDDLAAVAAGEIYAIYLQPAYWGKGYGAALMQRALLTLAQADYTLATLWVLEGNQRAMRFYELAGFQADGATQQETLLGGVTVHEVRYRRHLDDIVRLSQ